MPLEAVDEERLDASLRQAGSSDETTRAAAASDAKASFRVLVAAAGRGLRAGHHPVLRGGLQHRRDRRAFGHDRRERAPAALPRPQAHRARLGAATLAASQRMKSRTARDEYPSGAAVRGSRRDRRAPHAGRQPRLSTEGPSRDPSPRKPTRTPPPNRNPFSPTTLRCHRAKAKQLRGRLPAARALHTPSEFVAR